MFNHKNKRIKELESELLEVKKQLKVSEDLCEVRTCILQCLGLNITKLENGDPVGLLNELSDSFSVAGRGFRKHLRITTDYSDHNFSDHALEWFDVFIKEHLSQKSLETIANREERISLKGD